MLSSILKKPPHVAFSNGVLTLLTLCCKDYATATTEIVAAAMAESIDRSVTYCPVESGGAMKAVAPTVGLL